MATGYGSLGSGLAQGFLGARALTQKRDAAAATAKYQQGALDSQALDKQIAGTEFLIKDTQAKLENIRQAKLQTKDAAQLEKLDGLENNLLDAGATLIGQYGKMTGMDMSQLNPREMLAAGAGTPAERKPTVVPQTSRLVDPHTGEEIVGTAPPPQARTVMWQDNKVLLVDPNDEGNVIELYKGTAAGQIPKAQLVIDVKGRDGTTFKWIHSSIMPEGFDKTLLTGAADDIDTPLGIFTQTGYVPVSEGGPNTSIAPAWLLHPNPATGQARIVPYNKNTMSEEDYQAHLKAGYRPVGTPGWGTATESGVAVAGLAPGTTGQRFDETADYTKSVVESAMTKQLFRDLHRAGAGVVGVPGYLREHLGGALGALFAPIGLDGEAGFNDLINWATGGDLSADEVANIRTKFKQMIAPAVKVYTGEQSGRITKEEREIGFQTLAATKALRSITQARQALLGMLTLQESEQMRIRALLGQEQLVDMTNYAQFSEFANQLYNDMGGQGEGSENHAMIMGGVNQVMDNLRIIQKAIKRGVQPGGVLTDRKWAQSKAAN